MNPKISNPIDEYIKNSPDNVRKRLILIRQIVKKAAPKAEETINYRMPAFKMNGKYLVFFAGFNKHIGFYPTPSAIPKFRNELSKYKTSKGAIQFPLDKPLPVSLITRIVKFRVKENMGTE